MPPLDLVIVGDSAFAEIACEYFTRDSEFTVRGFCVERQYLSRRELAGLPVVAMEEVETHFDPSTHHFYAALVYTQLNRLRTRLYRDMKARGYRPASYVSTRASIWPNVSLGEHCFIFEDNTLQAFSRIGDNVVLWSGNHIGHHTRIGDHCFVSSHVVVSGFCEVGTSCFLGVNAAIANNLVIGDDCLVGAGALVARDLPADSLVKAAPSPLVPAAARARFGVVD